MKQHKQDIRDHIQLQGTKLCTIWRITRRDNTVLGVTDHDVSFQIDGVTYQPDLASAASQVDKQTGGGSDAQDIFGSIIEGTITYADLVNGKYDFARVDIARVRWDEVPKKFTETETIWLMSGYFGEVRHGADKFEAELRSLAQLLHQNCGRVTTALCDNDLFDANCKVSAAAHKVSSTVGSVPNSKQIGCTLTQGAGFFTEGTITFTSGPASGFTYEIKWYSTGAILLFENMEIEPNVGDSFDIYPGCDKTTTTCNGRFSNILNFRGFPFIPGKDKWTAGFNQ